jgi:hypothetical protein
MTLGVLVGLAAGVWVAIGVENAGLHWVVAVGLVKLTVVASLALLAAGAVLTRVANRDIRESAAAQGELGAGSTAGLESVPERAPDASRRRP